MNSSKGIDTYVICYTGRNELWAAFSIKTTVVGLGPSPREALAKAIATVERAGEVPAAQQSGTHTHGISYELMLTLAKTAQPWHDGKYTPGIVYKYEHLHDPDEEQETQATVQDRAASGPPVEPQSSHRASVEGVKFR